MKISCNIHIKASKEQVWKVITNIEASENFIKAIDSIEILDNPNSLIGFKWKETREFLGKKATEIMWITKVKENEYYQTRAESHGSIYISDISILPKEDDCILEINFTGTPQTLMAKIMSFLFTPFFKKATQKAFLADLQDIKQHIEAN